MFITDFFAWWYLRGWSHFASVLLGKLRNMTDFFSISLLIRTLFAPFRQISTMQDTTEGGPVVYLQIFFDKLLSRTIGCIVRLGILIFGTVVILLEAACSLLLVVVWPVAPLLPVACVALAVMGVTL